MRLLILCLFALCARTVSLAQTYADSVGDFRPTGLMRFQLGTTGPGLFYTRVLSREAGLNLRLGGQYVAYRRPVRVETAPGSYLRIAPDFMIALARADLTWHPFQRRSFFIVAGLGYTWHPDLSFVVTADSKLVLDGLELTPDDVGTIQLGFRWHPVVGYVGWGFAPFAPRKRMSVGFEMGVFYLGRPQVLLHYEGFLETTNLDEQRPIVERNLANYRYLPAVNLILSYALNRRR